MKKAVLLLVVLGLGGCATHASSTDTSQDDRAYKARQMCQNTAIGSNAKTVCY